MVANNLDTNSDFVREQFTEPSIEETIPLSVITGGSGFVSSINGVNGSITFSGGTTGLTFGAAGATVSLAGTLAIANGGTGATSAAAARTALGAAASGVNTDITQLNGASQVDVTGSYKKSGVQVVGARKTGWSTATGTATRTTFDTATVTLPELAERVKALLDDLHQTAGHGMIGT